MAADRPYGDFYDFYSVSPEYFGYYHIKYATYGTKHIIDNDICALKKVYMTVYALKERDWVFCNKNQLMFMENKLLF
jgi:hypothetical protein